MIPIRFLTVSLALAGLTPAAPYALAREPHPDRPFYNHFTEQDEERIGRAMAAQIEKNGVAIPGPKGHSKIARVDRNVLLEAYLESVAAHLGEASQRPGMTYRVRVINAPRLVNATSIPGGHIYIYSGLLDFVQSESELASVLGHEIGHVVAAHSMNRLARIAAAAGLIEDAREANIIRDDATALKIAAKAIPILFTIDARTFYSRDDEIEADLLGFYEMERAGWNPNGEASMLSRLASLSPNPGWIAAMINTYPASSIRLQIVRQELAGAALPDGLSDDGVQFKAMKIWLHS